MACFIENIVPLQQYNVLLNLIIVILFLMIGKQGTCHIVNSLKE